MTAIRSFLDSLEHAKQRLEQAPDAEHLTRAYLHHDGVLHGYFLAGGTSVVEANAAHADLRLAYEAKKGLFDLRDEWNRRNRAAGETA